MPTYEYRCPDGHEFERFYRKMSDAVTDVTCPICGKIAERQLSAGAGLLFKGSGFYLTDYGKNAHRTSGDAPPNKGESAAAAANSGDSKSTESKSGDSKAGESKSSETKPSDAKSGDSKRESKAGDSKPAEAKATDRKSGGTSTTSSSTSPKSEK